MSVEEITDWQNKIDPNSVYINYAAVKAILEVAKQLAIQTETMSKFYKTIEESTKEKEY